MTEKDLKKLSRRQLLELLILQTERADSLEKSLAESQKKLEDKIIAHSKAGSIAEASLSLNGVFASAQSAADQYLENIRMLEKKAEERLEAIERERALFLEEFQKEKEAFENKKNAFLEMQKNYIPLVDEIDEKAVKTPKIKKSKNTKNNKSKKSKNTKKKK